MGGADGAGHMLHPVCCAWLFQLSSSICSFTKDQIFRSFANDNTLHLGTLI